MLTTADVSSETAPIVVVSESGAPRDAWSAECAGASDVVVIAQLDGEPVLDFARRSICRLGRLEAAPAAPRKAIFALGDAPGPASLASRCMLSRALLASLQNDDDCVLVLAGAAHHPRAHGDLVCLADALTEHLFGTRRTLHVRFGQGPEQAPPKSQTRLRAVDETGQQRRRRTASA